MNNKEKKLEITRVAKTYMGANFKELCHLVNNEVEKLCPEESEEKEFLKNFGAGTVMGVCASKSISVPAPALPMLREIFGEAI